MKRRRSARPVATGPRIRRKSDFRDFLDTISLAVPDRIVVSAWLEHAPFAFWLVKTLQPGTLVETGPTASIFDSPTNEVTGAYVSGRFG